MARPHLGARTGPRVLFTASLEFSGSTLLELLLSSLAGTVGVGELKAAFVRISSGDGLTAALCQCGEPATSCPLWSEVLHRVGDEPPDRTAFYEHLLGAVAAVFGDDTVVIDSSKRVRFLHSVASVTPPVDVRVIRLTRDVRAWSVSTRGHGRPLDKAPLPRWIRRSYPYLLVDWYRRNKSIDAAVDALDLPTFRVGYEQYATDPTRYLSAMAEFAGLEMPHAAVIDDPNTHMIGGNIMRFDDGRRSQITYDTRWMAQSGWLGASTVLYPVMRYNTRSVYEPGGAG